MLEISRLRLGATARCGSCIIGGIAATLKRPRAILLASRESLSPIAGEPLLARTVRQLRGQGMGEVTVVARGCGREAREALGWAAGVVLIEEKAAAGSGVGALCLGLEHTSGSVLVVEGGVALDEPAAAEVATAARSGESIWFTEGRLRPGQDGGVLKADSTGAVSELRHLERYERRFDRHRKLLGVLAIGAKQRPLYQRLLREAAAFLRPPHYLSPWADSLRALPCSAYNLAHRRVANLGSPEGRRRGGELFGAGAVVPAELAEAC